MAIKRFEDIQSWKEAKKLVTEIYRISKGKEFSRDFALQNQIRRAAISIMSNIAEGFGRRTNKGFRSFLAIANGSALEVQSHLYIAHELGYISKQRFNKHYEQTKTVSRLIGEFIKYLSRK